MKPISILLQHPSAEGRRDSAAFAANAMDGPDEQSEYLGEFRGLYVICHYTTYKQIYVN